MGDVEGGAGLDWAGAVRTKTLQVLDRHKTQLIRVTRLFFGMKDGGGERDSFGEDVCRGLGKSWEEWRFVMVKVLLWLKVGSSREWDVFTVGPAAKGENVRNAKPR